MSAPTLQQTPANALLHALIDPEQSLDCIHCGLCLHTCPTYLLTGNEATSPRGRVHLMRAQAEGRLEADADFEQTMDSCLLCLRCESVCPAGVRFESMMQHCRDSLNETRPKSALARLARHLGFNLILPSQRRTRLAFDALGLAQRLGLMGLARRIAGWLPGNRGEALDSMSPVPSRSERRPLPAVTPAPGGGDGAVWLMEGCVMTELFGRVNRASARVLGAAGVDCHGSADHNCCGSLHAHNGDLKGARRQARSTIEASEALVDAGGEPLPVVVNSAGCGAHMKNYERLLEGEPEWEARARAFSARVVDLNEFLATPERLTKLAPQLGPAHLGTVVYDDPCHLCHGQGIRDQPRTLLAAIPDLKTVELEDPEACCGSAGIHSLLRPAESAAQFKGKLADLRACGADTLVTANPGCHMQWAAGVLRAGAETRVLHMAEVLERSLDGGTEA